MAGTLYSNIERLIQTADMEYKLQDLIDIPLFQSLQDKLNELYSFPSAILDNEGNFLTSTAWQDICGKFHRVNPESALECRKSDQYIAAHLTEANPAVIYFCPHGLVDVATPILIERKHIGTFFTGQFLMEKPDILLFQEQAKKYEFDENKYLEAVSKVPVWSTEHLNQYLSVIKTITEILTELGYKNLKEIKERKIIEVQIAELQRMESNLRMSENRFKQIAENSSDYIWEVDITGLFTYCSDKIKDILGYSSNEVIGKKHFWDFFAADRHQELKVASLLLIEHRESFRHVVYPYKHKNGQTVIIEASGSPNFDEKGNLLGSRGTATDITQRMQIQDALHEQEITLRAITTSVKDCILMIDNNGRIIFWNEAASTIFGYTQDEVIGKNLHQLIMPERFIKKHFISFSKFQLTGQAAIMGKTVELLGLNKGQQEIPIELSLGSVNIRGKWFAVGVIRDITERKEAEKSLRDSEEKYKAAFKTIPDAIVLTKLDGMVVDVNIAFTKLSGFTRNEAIGSNLADLNLYGKSEDRTRLIEALQTNGLIENFETPMRSKNGIVRIAQMSASIISINNEKHILSITRDITERKVLEDELIKAKEKAEAVSRLKSSLLLNMSHEIRTPLNGILGFAGLLSDSLMDSEQKSMATIISQSGKRLLATLNSIMELAQVEADRTVMELETIDIGIVTADVLKKQQSLFESKRIQLIESIEKQIYSKLDITLLSSIVFHLIDNAVKYTNKGSVCVSVDKVVKNKQQIAILRVQDTGIGISEQQLGYVFDEFRQGDEGTGRSYEGTGLGLTLSKKFALLMGGEIEVESQVGLGTTFTVTFPLSNETPIPKQDCHKEDYTLTQYLSTKKPKVLIVEDNKPNSDLIAIYLKEQFITDQAGNGILAVQMATLNIYDVILMDINLGHGLGGIEATKQIKEISRNQTTPIIAITGYFTEEEKKYILSQGLDDFLSKPFDKESLTSVIKRVLKKTIA